MANSVVFPRAQFFSNSGRPLVGGRIHTYVAGSSTRARTYQDAANVQINTNPIILDARGEAAIYLAEGVEYKFVVEDSTGALIMTQEPVYGAIWPNAAEWPSDATLSYQYMTEAKAAASASGPIKFYDTKAQADAAIETMVNGDIIEISQDETRAGARTRYKVQAGALVFVVNLDQLRIDIAASGGAGLVGATAKGTGAVPRTVKDRLDDFISILNFIPTAQHAALFAGTSTYDASGDFLRGIAAANASGCELDCLGLVIRLSETLVATGGRVRNLSFQPIGAVPQRTLNVTADNFELRNTRIDFKGGDSIRPIQVQAGVKGFKIDGLLMKNVAALTYFRGVEISGDGTEFEVKNVTGRNMSVTKNAVIGDDNGSMRLVIVRGNSPAVASCGVIDTVYGYNCGNVEDTDLVVAQIVASTLLHNIEISNIHAIGTSKRAVKIQCDGPTVTNASNRATDPAQVAYSAVSAYGACTVTGARAFGNIKLGVDVIGDATVRDVKLNTTNPTQSFAVLVDGGNPVLSDIDARGMAQGVLSITENSQSSNVTARGITGGVQLHGIEFLNNSSTAGRDISANISDVDITCATTGRALYALAGGLGTKTNLTLADIKGTVAAGASYAAYLAFANVEIDGMSVKGGVFQSVAIVGATRADVNALTGNGCTGAALLYSACSNTVSTRIRGAGNSGVNITAGNNHIVNGVSVPLGATPVVQNSAPTNVVTANLQAFTS